MPPVNIKAGKTIKEPFAMNADILEINNEEREILLSLSNDITAVRDKKDILKLIHPKIKRLFSTDDIFICFLDSLNETLDPILRVGGADRTKHTDYYRTVNSSFPIHDGFIDAILNSEDPVIVNLENFRQSHTPPGYMKLFLATGIIESLSISLHNAGEVIGILTLWSEKKNFFNGHHKKLMTAIANNISIVVINILANHEIANREEEKTVLLALSNEIAELRNRDDFFEVVIHKIKKIFAVDGFAISQINEDRKTYRAFKLEDQYKFPNPLFYNRILTDTYSVDDCVYSEIMNSEEPVLFRVDELARKANIPTYVNLWKSIGICEVVCVALRVGGKFTGTASFHSLKNSPIDIKSGLLKSVCAQLAVKVSNILAYENIAKREEEKTILLSLSNEIAAVKNRNDLFDIVNSRLKSFFSIEEFGIAQINSNHKTYSAFIHELEESLNKHTEFRGITSYEFSVNDKIFKRIMNSGDPVLFDVDQVSEEPEMPAYVHFWKKAGQRRILGVALRVSGEDIGFAILHIDKNELIDIKSSLLKGICAQLAVKMSNILAYEEIARREVEKTILLRLSNEIAGLRNRADFFDVVISQLKKIFTFDGFAITYIHEDGKTYGVFNVDRQYNVQSIPGYENVMSKRLPVTDYHYNIIIHSEEPVLFKVDEMAVDDNPLTLAAFAKNRGIKQLLSVPLRVGGKTIGVASFHFFGDVKIEAKSSLLKSVCAQLSVAVSNILANEKVLDQLNEINRYKQQLEGEKIYLKEEIESSHNYAEVVGESAEIKKVFRLVTQVAYSDSTVLILGETGTGKELIARAIHNSSTRKSRLMIKVNCAALPVNLVESELFGHERGSFTGAIERRIGKFELANNGTLFLDEIGEMTPELQVKLLRALQEKEIERVGGKTTIKTDVRIIAATNRDLEKLMEEGKFRSDLFYRLNIFPISLPPLRNRREDIPHLVSYFIVRYAKKAGKTIKTISNKVLQELIQYDWPGNIRELEHLIERSVLLTTGDTIKEIHLPHSRRNISSNIEKEETPIKTIDEIEREHILRVLKHSKGRIGGMGGAAEILGIPTSTLNSRMKRLGIRKEHT